MTPTPAFISPLRVERIANDQWHLLEPLCYRSAMYAELLTVPAGFNTDFASVPRWLPVAYATTGGVGQPAAVVHDWLYQTHYLNRQLADAIFWEALRVLGEPAWRCYVMWAAVRTVGGRAYAAYQKRLMALRNIAASRDPNG